LRIKCIDDETEGLHELVEYVLCNVRAKLAAADAGADARASRETSKQKNGGNKRMVHTKEVNSASRETTPRGASAASELRSELAGLLLCEFERQQALMRKSSDVGKKAHAAMSALALRAFGDCVDGAAKEGAGRAAALVRAAFARNLTEEGDACRKLEEDPLHEAAFVMGKFASSFVRAKDVKNAPCARAALVVAEKLVLLRGAQETVRADGEAYSYSGTPFDIARDDEARYAEHAMWLRQLLGENVISDAAVAARAVRLALHCAKHCAPGAAQSGALLVLCKALRRVSADGEVDSEDDSESSASDAGGRGAEHFMSISKSNLKVRCSFLLFACTHFLFAHFARHLGLRPSPPSPSRRSRTNSRRWSGSSTVSSLSARSRRRRARRRRRPPPRRARPRPSP
jgi:hypothetical protein